MKGRKIQLFLACLASLYFMVSASDQYKLILHSQKRGAACLDGSRPGAYIHEGSEQNKDKFLIYFEGGGFCGDYTLESTIQSCYARSKGSLGSTKNAAKTKQFNQGILSPHRQQNPNFYDWTKVFILYCDGSTHQGNRTQPISFQGSNLYFRGTSNSLQQFHYLNETYDFYNGQRIVISGVSAGGIGAYEWSEYLYQNTKTAEVLAIPDSGLFLPNFYSTITEKFVLRQKVKTLLNLIGENLDDMPEPVKKCVISHGGDAPTCVDASQYSQFISAPIFIVQSPYDEWNLDYVLEVNCLPHSSPPYSLQYCNDSTRDLIEHFNRQMVESLQTMMDRGDQVGVWSPDCVQHGFAQGSSLTSEKYKVPTSTGITLSDAISEFLKNPNHAPRYQDKGEWPMNTGCSGLSSLRQYVE